MSAAVQGPPWLSVPEFLAWEPGDGRTWQLVDGAPVAMAPANRTHGTLQAELGGQIWTHLRQQGSPCVLVTTPGVIPHVQSRHNVRIPDLAVTCTPYGSEEPALTDPVLLIEVLSPTNRAETWANVWAYTTIPSVREILVLHTDTVRAELLRRLPDGSWPQQPADLIDGELALDSIGFRAPLHGLYRGTRLSL